MTRPLKVYKASAGSGKTFTLAVEYIKLLIADPEVYKHILAVTFTKKATGEMKNRILSQLYGIANNLSSSDGYLAEIKMDDNIKRLGFSDNEIRCKAATALSNIMHDYSRFHVTTIDSFFQSIVRELARELDLTANLKVDLNDGEVLSEAVTSIIDDLEEGTETFNYILSYVKEKINEGKNWIITGEIEEFGKNIFNERYLEKERLIRDKIGDKRFMGNYRERIRNEAELLQKEIVEKGKTFLDMANNDNLTVDHFKQKSRGIYGYFQKLSMGATPEPNSYVLNCLNNDEEWLTSRPIRQEYVDLLNETYPLIKEHIKASSTSAAIISHINHLMMLDMITARIRTLNQEANRFLLADTARFLRDMIDESDIPFIYERTGNRFKHIMIDEFQDTSSLQWENFKPLLKNSLSENKTCLLVGDVKQSIYRWRNSDWNILNNIQNQELADEIEHSTLNKLDTNRRSLGVVVEFNNDFFMNSSANVESKYTESCGQKTSDVGNAYSSVKQKIHESNKGRGYVAVYDIHPTKDSTQDYTQLTLAGIQKTIYNLTQNKRVKPNDIAILVREKKQIEAICMAFADNNDGINIVSEDAFKLCSSSAVNIIIAAMSCISNPDNIISRLTLAYLYQTEVLDNKDFFNDIDRLLCSAITEQNEDAPLPFHALLPSAFDENKEKLLVTPLAELAEQIYDIFALKNIEQQDSYLFSFYDCVSSYLNDFPDDIGLFMTKWEEGLKDTTIPNNSLDGIRIMTIHKSKGLEFHTVIVPFCHWSMGGRSDTMLWCKPEEKPYNDLPLTPVNYTKNIQSSIFKRDYDEETLKCYVDNLNLIYVAFTRAGSNLIVFTGKHGNGYSANDVIKSSIPQKMHTSTDDIVTTYTTGEIEPSKKPGNDSKTDADQNVMTKTPLPLHLLFSHYDTQPQFKQSNESKRFLSSDSDNGSAQYIDIGNIVHHILEYTCTHEDLPSAIRKVESEGVFKNEEQKKRIISIVQNALQNDKAKEWFSGKWRVLNERSILTQDKKGNTTTIRPDRVMTDGSVLILIDYKTGRYSSKHKEQMTKYIDHLQRMGKTNIKAYLWYVVRSEIIPVIP